MPADLPNIALTNHNTCRLTNIGSKFRKNKEAGTLILGNTAFSYHYNNRDCMIIALLASTPLSTVIHPVVRAGDSVCSDEMTFTGWIDVDLSEHGTRQIENAARLMVAGGYTVDVVFTSRLKRAIRSGWILMREINQVYRPVFKSWRLNERMYGALEGLSKPLMAKELGEDVVQKWRRSFFSRPPPMLPDHKHWHGYERKYSDLITAGQVPTTESLQDTMERTLPLWNSRILPLLTQGQNVLVVAHGNSLRGIVKHIDALTPEQIQSVRMPIGIPLVYKFNMCKHAILTPKKLGSANGCINGER